LKKLEIQLKEEKSLSEKEISSLKSALSEEKKRRQNAQEEKVERNNRLLQDLLEKDDMIFKLQRELQKYQLTASVLGTPINGGNEYMVNQSIGEFKSALQAGNLSKAALSPLRSLDFGLLNNASFTLANKSQNGLRNSQNRKKGAF